MSDKLEFDPEAMDSLHVYKLITGCIVPRPIGFITTVNPARQVNAAPFSFFNGLSHAPPLVCFSPGKNSRMGTKDTLRNVRATREFVVNIVDEAIVERVNICATEFPSNVNELEAAGLTAVPSKRVCAPRVAESPVNLECKLWRIIRLPGGFNTLVIGVVLFMHVRAEVMAGDGRIDPQKLRAVGRMAGNAYAKTGELFALSYDAFNVVPKA